MPLTRTTKAMSARTSTARKNMIRSERGFSGETARPKRCRERLFLVFAQPEIRPRI
jgi:hypothetical protein